MMESWYDRTALLLNENQLQKLKNANLFIAGLGGVGAYAAECLCRAGVGQMTLVDYDKVSITNINRQLMGLHSNIGQSKVHLMADRFRDINPDIKLNVLDTFLLQDSINDLLQEEYNYVVDAIDTLSPKVNLVEIALKRKIPVISSLGAGGKLSPDLIKVADIADTYSCNLGRMFRKRLHKRGIRTGFKAVFSPEPIPMSAIREVEGEKNKKTTVGTISYMPALFGLRMAAKVINDLIMED